MIRELLPVLQSDLILAARRRVRLVLQSVGPVATRLRASKNGGNVVVNGAVGLDVGPVLRWAGSKRWLVRKGLPDLIGPVTGTYHEPFLGSASVFLAIGARKARLSDSNANLINFYEQIRSNHLVVLEILGGFNTGPEGYYSTRAKFPDADPKIAAAQFLFLNIFGFNGLYRENASGKFNVPFGRPKNETLPSAERLGLLAETLQHDVHLKCSEFKRPLRAVRSGDTVYLDPPYVAGHRANGFVDYNKRLFTWSDQVDLAREFHRLDKVGARVFLSNADHASVRDLYTDWNSREFSRFSSMASNVGARGRTQELLISNT